MDNMEVNAQNAEFETLLEYDSAEDFSDTDRQVTRLLIFLYYY
jgi:hypothetical protein